MAAAAEARINATIIWKGTHKRGWIRVMATGMENHGVPVRLCWWSRFDRLKPEAQKKILAGVVVTWGWRLGQRFRQLGCPVLVMENPPIDAGDDWVSLGWNGLNGRATFPQIDDGGERWERHFGSLLRPWKNGGDYVLLVGQVRNDASLNGMPIGAWYRDTAERLRCRFRGWPVMFRSHPGDPKAQVEGVQTINGNLADALAGAAVVVTYSSRVGVDAALAGVPVIACDEGSMAWPVAAHGLEAPLTWPDRTPWARQLAWCQWTMAEVQDGSAWGYVRQAQ